MTLPVTTESDDAKADFYEGLYALDVGRPNEANDAFEAAVADDPDFAYGYLMIASSATSTEEFTTNLARAVELADNASPAEAPVAAAGGGETAEGGEKADEA